MENLFLLIINILGNIIQFIEPFYRDYGYLIVFFTALFEHSAILGFFMPGGTTIALSGFYAAQGVLSLPAIILLAWLGFNAGENLDYWVGRKGGSKIIEKLKWEKKIAPFKEALNKNAKKTIILAQVISPSRALVMLVSGIAGVPYKKFLILNLLLTIPLTLFFVLLGFYLGENRVLLEYYLKQIAKGEWFLIVIILVFVLYKARKKLHQVIKSKLP